MPNATTTALLDNLRSQVTGATDDVLKLELFNACDELARDVLYVGAPTDPTADPATWIPSEKWVAVYQPLLEGTLARLFAQPQRPWSNPEFAALHQQRYMAFASLTRDDTLTAPAATVYDRLVGAVQTQVPLARAGAIRIEVYNTADKIRRDALSLAPLTDADSAATSWLPSGQWDDCYQALLSGALYRLLTQVGKPWSNAELGKAQYAIFTAELDLLRSDTLTAPATTVYSRLLTTIQTELPQARAGTVSSAIYSVADKIRRDALQLGALTDADSAPSSWLPADQWDDCFQALYTGALTHLLAQTGRPWSNPDQAKVQLTLFLNELDLLRADALTAPTITIYNRLLATVQVQIPSARAGTIRAEIYNAVDKVRRDALQLVPLTDADGTPTTWLATDQWDDCYQAVLAGTLAQLFTQTGKPWSNPELAKAKFAQFLLETDLLRSDTLAATTTTVYTRLVAAVQSQVPLARAGVVRAEVYKVADKIRRDALQLPALADADSLPSSWLPADQWDDCFQALYAGTLTHLLSQTGKPWGNPDQAKVQLALFTGELELLRSDALGIATATTATVYDRLLAALQAQMPLVRPSTVRVEIYNTADKLRRDALQLAPLTDASTTPTSWLPADQWDDCYQALLLGTLARLLAQTGKPWSNPDQAKIQLALFTNEMALLRADSLAGSSATVYDRLVGAIQTQIPGARASSIRPEIYNIADKLRREALRLAPLSDANTAPSSWLPSDKWDDCYQALLAGVLYRLFAQVGQPWSNPELAKAQYATFQIEMELVRGESASAASTAFAKFMDMGRIRLPGARDNIIQVELFAALQEFLGSTNLWQEELEFDVVPGETDYPLFPTNTSSINRLLWVVDQNGVPVAAGMSEPGTITLANVPTTAQTYRANVSLVCSEPTSRDGFPIVPDWVSTKYLREILEGTLGRMMTQIGKPYSNQQLAIYHMRRFRGAMSQAKVEAQRQNVYRVNAWRFPQAFSSVRRR